MALARRPTAHKAANAADAAFATDGGETSDLAAAVVLLAREQRLGNILLRDIALQLRAQGRLLASIEHAVGRAWAAARRSVRRRAEAAAAADARQWLAAGRAAALLALVVFLALAGGGGGGGGRGGGGYWASISFTSWRWLPGSKRKPPPQRHFFAALWASARRLFLAAATTTTARRRTAGPRPLDNPLRLLSAAARTMAVVIAGWTLLLAWAACAWRRWWGRGGGGGGGGNGGGSGNGRRNPLSRALLWPAARAAAARWGGAGAGAQVDDEMVGMLADEAVAVALDASVGGTGLFFALGGGGGGGGKGAAAAAAAAVVWASALAGGWFPLSLWCWRRSGSASASPLEALGLAVLAHVLAPVGVAAMAFL